MLRYRYDDCNTFFQKIGKIGPGAILTGKMSLLSQPKLLAAGIAALHATHATARGQKG